MRLKHNNTYASWSYTCKMTLSSMYIYGHAQYFRAEIYWLERIIQIEIKDRRKTLKK